MMLKIQSLRRHSRTYTLMRKKEVVGAAQAGLVVLLLRSELRVI
jgi:hypothetical protein